MNEWEEHLEELRRRVVVVLVVFFAASAAAFVFSSHIAAFLMAPVARFGVQLYTFAPTEKFMAYLYLSVWTGTLFTAPFFFLQTALFLWPALRGDEYRWAAAVLFVVPSLFTLGAALCYRFLAPVVFGFLLSFGAGDGIASLWGLREYLGLLFDLMLAVGLLLQMPLALLVLIVAGVVSPRRVARCRPHIVLVIFLLAAVLTPPDVISQVMLGVPVYLLFEGALFLGRILRVRSADDEVK
ncbi:MAG: twin-arginine translocase subunit TatC [Synergistaceae bacterium]|jgi:sec-independent protein translocase protein TatC|nr:twin-arginine translocase subunit TatC [Synergistaceae bacterium]